MEKELIFSEWRNSPFGPPSVAELSLDLTALYWEVGCGVPVPASAGCDQNSPYRTITGDCNNR